MQRYIFTIISAINLVNNKITLSCVMQQQSHAIKKQKHTLLCSSKIYSLLSIDEYFNYIRFTPSPPKWG